jgi:pyruvate/2-oxoglutarate dehydrogenase complex dihydrolipoamide dehydrogenase (E3) component
MIVRSILLRGFDQDMAGKIGAHMTKHGVKFIREAVPIKFAKTKNGKILVTSKSSKTGETFDSEYDTVLLAIGRYALTAGIGLDKIGVKMDKNGKIHVSDSEQSSISNIYSIGDCAVNRPELTPPAAMVNKKTLIIYDLRLENY